MYADRRANRLDGARLAALELEPLDEPLPTSPTDIRSRVDAAVMSSIWRRIAASASRFVIPSRLPGSRTGPSLRLTRWPSIHQRPYHEPDLMYRRPVP